MKPALQIAQALISPQSAKFEPPLQPVKPAKLRQGLLDNLWLKMTELYGHRWTGSFGVSADQSHAWAAALGGLTGPQIAVGLASLVASDEKWPPSAPEFRALCENRDPACFGLPCEALAYQEACRRAHPAGGAVEAPWSHPAVCHAALETGFSHLATLKEDASRKLFARNYQAACRMVMDGQPLKAIPLGLPDPYSASSVRTEEGGRKGLAGLRAALRGGVAQ
ncbi:replication protein P [Pseudomonas leptonychotis]|uniref:replication protein P n=1 Tax=Pseudomonas leptonychotis TaxID=2448482 RepID=UPI00387089B7